MRSTFIRTLVEEAESNKDIMLLTGDLGYSLLEDFQRRFPDRFINMGVAEQNMIGVAAGLALTGKKVFVYSIIPFVTFRCLEQIRNDLCYHDLGVVIVGVGSGVTYGPLGFSHHAIEDIGALRSIPNMTILTPSDPVEVRCLLKACMKYDHPVYLRLGKTKEETINKSDDIAIGHLNVLEKGRDILFITHGNIAHSVKLAFQRIKSEGFQPSLATVPTLKPFNDGEFLSLLKEHKKIIVVEKHNRIGGLGDAIFNLNMNNKNGNKFLHIALEDNFVTHIGDSDHLRKLFRMDSESIYRRASEFIKEDQ
jgi:transketolase